MEDAGLLRHLRLAPLGNDYTRCMHTQSEKGVLKERQWTTCSILKLDGIATGVILFTEISPVKDDCNFSFSDSK